MYYGAKVGYPQIYGGKNMNSIYYLVLFVIVLAIAYVLFNFLRIRRM